MIIAGIDPGLSGAVALLDGGTGTVVDIFDMPTLELKRGGKTKREIDPHALAAALGRDRIGHAFIEAVGAMPGQGVASMFAFGKAFGIAIGVVSTLGIPSTLVAPMTWKKAMKVPAGKDAARARAAEPRGRLPHPRCRARRFMCRGQLPLQRTGHAPAR
jgi:crossover junction endodeoxyribonuclease RuvC